MMDSTTLSIHDPDNIALAMPHDDVTNHRAQIAMVVLKGRMRLAVFFALLLGIPAAFAGFMLGSPIYRSVAPIHVIPVVPRVLYTDEEKGALPRYESFVETQVDIIGSQRVLDLAMQDAAWRGVQKAGVMNTPLAFSKAIDVTRKNEIITVAFDDKDADRAMAGAQSIVNAYKKILSEDDSLSENRRLEVLQGLRTQLTNDLAGKNQRLAEIAKDYGVSDISRLRDAKFTELQKLTDTESDIRLQLALAAPSATTLPVVADIPQLMAADSVLADMVHRQQSAEDQLNVLETTLGPAHKAVIVARADVAQAKVRVDERVEQLKKSPLAFIRSQFRQSNDIQTTTDVEVLKNRQNHVEGMIADKKKEYEDISKIDIQVGEMNAQIDEIKKSLEQTTSRLDQLNVEANISGRISANAPAERPLEPFKDSRKKLAVFGGFAGVVAGFGSVLLFGLADRRIRGVHELKARLSIDHVLGVLPEARLDSMQDTNVGTISHAVHHIRSMLQIRGRGERPAVVITSPVSGTGKTSIALALGVSYATSGAKVLLIDCDLVGGGLTERVKASAHRRLGRLLKRNNVLQQEQLKEALSIAKEQGRKLGEIIVEKGFLTNDEVNAWLGFQKETSMGVIDALNGEPLNHCTAETVIPQLHILPLGEATQHDIGSLSHGRIQKLLVAAKRSFDVIVIDTGPIPGSLEASIVASAADGVVMLLSRGESRPIAEACLKQIRSIGANFEGVIFNRVASGDMPIYTTSKAQGRASRPSQLRERQELLARVDEVADFGPIARAVVAAAPSGSSMGVGATSKMAPSVLNQN